MMSEQYPAPRAPGSCVNAHYYVPIFERRRRKNVLKSLERPRVDLISSHNRLTSLTEAS